MDKQYKYKNIGCKEEFKYRIQVIRHATRRKNLSQLQQKRIDITTNKIICIVGLNVTQTIYMYRTYADINAHFPKHSSSVLIVEKYSNLKAG